MKTHVIKNTLISIGNAMQSIVHCNSIFYKSGTTTIKGKMFSTFLSFEILDIAKIEYFSNIVGNIETRIENLD